MPRARTSSLAIALGLAASCAKGPTLSVQVSSGQEKGSLSATPAVTSITITALKADCTTQSTATATAPDWSFDLGNVDNTSPLSFSLTGFAADGKTVLAQGQSVSIVPGAISSGTLPLFIERLGGWSRPGGGVAVSHLHAPGGVLGERYIFLTGGDKAEAAPGTTGTPSTLGIDAYDLLSFGPAGSTGGFMRNAETMVVRADPQTGTTRVLIINHDGANWNDLPYGPREADLTPPTGLSFADVAGGRAIEGASGATYIVGATRDASPTQAVLVVDAAGNLAARSLLVPRAGAAAAYVDKYGIVIVGGSSSEPGVEVMPDPSGAETGSYPADATTGAALAPGLNGKAHLAGGMIGGTPAATRELDLTCDSACAFVPIGSAADIASRAQAFVMTGGFVTIGDDSSGQTRAFQVAIGQTTTVTELPFRDPRKGATAIPTPNGLLAVLGGELMAGGPALSVELLFPLEVSGASLCHPAP